jgi:hypothetical protein
MCGSRKGLQALISPGGYEHYSLKELKYYSERGCLMCIKLLEALQDHGIEDEPHNPGWINFFALDHDRNRIQGTLPVEKSNEVPLEARRMCYLETEGPKKNDFLIFMICAGEGELGSEKFTGTGFTNVFRFSEVSARSYTDVLWYGR